MASVMDLMNWKVNVEDRIYFKKLQKCIPLYMLQTACSGPSASKILDATASHRLGSLDGLDSSALASLHKIVMYHLAGHAETIVSGLCLVR